MTLLCVILGIVILILTVKIHIMKKDCKRITDGMHEKMNTDTNTLLEISTGDRDMKEMAACLNTQLAELKEMKHKYRQGDAELKSAVTNISHDLRTPLTSVMGYLELLDAEEKSDVAARYLSLIKNRINDMKSLTEEMFRYSVIITREEKLKTEKVCLNRVLEDAVAEAAVQLIKKGIDPKIEMPDAEVYCMGDKRAVLRVFWNILNNAAKYSDGDLHVCLETDGTVTFSNTAKELSSVAVGKLFDRFFTVAYNKKSTGLGLSIAKQLTEQMQGSINAQKHADMLTIRVCLPPADSV